MNWFKKGPKRPTPEMRQAIMVELLRRQTTQIANGHLTDPPAKILNECEFICNYLSGVYEADAKEVYAVSKALLGYSKEN